MYPRTNYEMTEDDLKALLAAMRSVPVMMIGNSTGPPQQENANDAWARLGAKMGFDHMTVEPIQGKGNRFFSAVPSETEEGRLERLQREGQEARYAEREKLNAEIAARRERLAELDGEDKASNPFAP